MGEAEGGAVGPSARPRMFPEGKGPSRGVRGYPAVAGFLVPPARRVVPFQQKRPNRPEKAAGDADCPGLVWACVVVCVRKWAAFKRTQKSTACALVSIPKFASSSRASLAPPLHVDSVSCPPCEGRAALELVDPTVCAACVMMPSH